MSTDEESAFDKLVGSNVQKYRKAKGLSQADLAAAISTPNEGVHQQTILKIEKGARPLKLSEAEKIAHALKISTRHLSDVPRRADVNARYIAVHAQLASISGELSEIAERLAPLLVNLAVSLASEATSPEEDRPSSYLIDHAQSWLEVNWGKGLNISLLEEIRETYPLTAPNPEFDANTYADVLRNLATMSMPRAAPGALDERLDASET
ncbi:helix-turn-helix transcriptional regulator [Mycobacteroides abscessus]|uniref:helix-turn-helix transcriptional regulator n=1 Tax=Mycobacteroides abscessus TaxID=36809 RepID=UPI002105BD2D|nr:helix-turn-helix transcriptional regulator [Mycobacteroides abscessus]